MQKVYEEISLSDHFLHLYGPSMMAKDTITREETPRALDARTGTANHAYVPDMVNVGPVGLPSSILLQNGANGSQWSSELFSRDERQSLKRALKSTDPIYKLH